MGFFGGLPTGRFSYARILSRQERLVEIIQQVRDIPGVRGVHLMAFRQKEFPSSCRRPAFCTS